tara:strand:- start:1446 stop:1874 length:429 start_codon:yes stop_codon:yes gene_type:complete
MIKSFRGKLAHDEQHRIRLSTNKGEIGYRVTKFQLMATTPGGNTYEYLCQIYKQKTDPSTTVDFTNPNLIAAAYLEGNNSTNYTDAMTVIFDNEVVNQDIYVTGVDVDVGTIPFNYYIELEQMKLDLNESTVATLRDMRGRE